MKAKISRSLLRSAGLAFFALTTGLGLEAQSTQTPPSPTAKPTGEHPASAAPKAQHEHPPPNPHTSQQRDVFRSRGDVVTTHVIVRDGKGQFVADLKKDDFEVYE